MPQGLRVAVAGIQGRMGTIAREALERSGEFCCGLARRSDSVADVVDSVDAVIARKPDVLLDLTTQPGSYDISLAAVARGLPTVIGTSGWNAEQRAVLAATAQERGVGVLLVPNFSLGATLMMRFAEQAARFFPDAEIVELHHAGKKDKPSGTARETAERMERASGRPPRDSQRPFAGAGRASGSDVRWNGRGADHPPRFAQPRIVRRRNAGRGARRREAPRALRRTRFDT